MEQSMLKKWQEDAIHEYKNCLVDEKAMWMQQVLLAEIALRLDAPELEEIPEDLMCYICVETNRQKLHQCHMCERWVCKEHSQLIDGKYWLCFEDIK